MWDNPFEFKYDAKGDYYDIVVDKKIQQVVNGLLVLPHHVLLRQLTYWSTDIDDGEYGIDSDRGREEWREITDCYATAKTEQQKYMYAGQALTSRISSGCFMVREAAVTTYRRRRSLQTLTYVSSQPTGQSSTRL